MITIIVRSWPNSDTPYFWIFVIVIVRVTNQYMMEAPRINILYYYINILCWMFNSHHSYCVLVSINPNCTLCWSINYVRDSFEMWRCETYCVTPCCWHVFELLRVFAIKIRFHYPELEHNESLWESTTTITSSGFVFTKPQNMLRVEGTPVLAVSANVLFFCCKVWITQTHYNSGTEP